MKDKRQGERAITPERLQWVNMVRIITAWYGIGWIDDEQREKMIKVLGPRPHKYATH